MPKKEKKSIKRLKEKSEKNWLEIAGFILSIFALFFSFKSCSDSNRALDISLNQSMAFLQVTDAELIEPIDSASFIKIKLTIKNLGQTPARDIKIEFDHGIKIGDFETEGNSTTRKEIGSIGQGFEKTVVLTSNSRNFRMWNVNSRFPDILCFFGTIFYKDKINENIEKKVDWCYELKLDKVESLKTRKITQSDSNRFESKYSQPNQ